MEFPHLLSQPSKDNVKLVKLAMCILICRVQSAYSFSIKLCTSCHLLGGSYTGQITYRKLEKNQFLTKEKGIPPSSNALVNKESANSSWSLGSSFLSKKLFTLGIVLLVVMHESLAM